MTTAVAPLRTVHLHGHLAEGIGREIKLAFKTPVEAVRLLELNFPGFITKLKEGWYRVIAVRNGHERTLEERHLPVGFSGDLVIMPALDGANDGKKKGLIGAILGAVIIGAAFFFSGGTLATPLVAGSTGLLGNITFASVAQFGVGLALNGVATLLSPTPGTGYDDVDEARSFIFNGPVNLTQPGGVVPLIYGRMMVGTYTVSTALDVEMLLSGSADEQDRNVLNQTFRFTRASEQIIVDLDDLIDRIEGATLTQFGGDNITQGQVNNGGINVNGLGLLDTRIDTTSTVMTDNGGAGLVTLTLPATNPQNVNTRLEVAYRVRVGSTDHDGTLTLEFGTPAEDVSFLGTYQTDTEIFGNDR